MLVTLCYLATANTASITLASLAHTCEAETFFFPVFRLVDSRADDFLHEILGISSVYAVCIFNCSVRHGLNSNTRLLQGTQTRSGDPAETQ